MRVLVATLDTVFEGDVIGGELLDGVSGSFDLQSVFTIRCDDGKCLSFRGWMVDVEIFRDSADWVLSSEWDVFSKARSVVRVAGTRSSLSASARPATR